MLLFAHKQNTFNCSGKSPGDVVAGIVVAVAAAEVAAVVVAVTV